MSSTMEQNLCKSVRSYKKKKTKISMKRLVMKRWQKTEQSTVDDNTTDPLEGTNVPLHISSSNNEPVAENLKEPSSGSSVISTLSSFFPTGRRIIDVSYFFQTLMSHKHHELFKCNFTNMEIIKETRIGFLSTFLLKCKICETCLTLHSENPESEMMNINVAAVSGTLSTGGGYSQLEEIMAVLNIPCISKDMYYKQQVKLSEIIEDNAWLCMQEAGKEEARIAIAQGCVDADGIPCITVVTDGAWCKRSFKNNYNASSGVACIIGQHTKQILFIGVRNKYCCICERAKTLNTTPMTHTCFKNWDGSSTAMESDIIVEGFKHSLEMHGLKYTKLVGDGDSSVHKKLIEARPYGFNTLIEKVECSNHLLRNYCNNLRELASRRYSSAGKPVSTNLRHLLTCNIKRLRSAVDCAAKHHRKNSNFLESSKKLKADLLNGVNHVFGDHKNCDIYFCKRKQLKENNSIPQMKECGLYNDILSLLNRIVFHVKSLLFNMTNNICESYNSVVAKFVGGKRINFSKRGNYRARCFAAVLSYNSKGKFHYMVHKSINKNSPGKYTKKFLARKNKDLNRQKKNFKPRKLFASTDKDYGPNVAEEVMCPEVFNIKKELFLKEIAKTSEQIKTTERNTVGQKNNLLWQSERMKRITASNFGTICKLRKTTNCAATVKSLLYNTFNGNIYTNYGLEKEPLAIKDLQEKLQVNVYECGLFIDSKDHYLAASPDGIIDANTIVEIKCPANSSKLTPEEAIESKKVKFAKFEKNKFSVNKNHSYYYQVQGQLHIADKLYCIFVFWTPKGMLYEKIRRDDDFWRRNMAEQLKNFYFDCVLPEIINPQLPKGLPIKNPVYRNK